VALFLVLLALAIAPSHGQAAHATVTAQPAAVRTVTVPRVVGRLVADAQRRLKAAGLRARVVRVRSLQEVGSVVSSRPTAGKRVARGTRVLIRVSSGPGP
jgi:beta-lactam-binding protein with PASTA domain